MPLGIQWVSQGTSGAWSCLTQALLDPPTGLINWVPPCRWAKDPSQATWTLLESPTPRAHVTQHILKKKSRVGNYAGTLISTQIWHEPGQDARQLLAVFLPEV